MRAIYIQKHGEPHDLKVSDVAKPTAATGELVVEVEAAGINPSDVVSLRGRFPEAVLPRILGRDFAGTIVEGPEELLGTKVWGTGGDLGITRNGTHAEYLVLPQDAAVARPEKLAAAEAAIVGVPFVAAFSALVHLGKLQQGEWVIVSGAAGAVGQAAIQLAAAKGARVVALIKDAADTWVSESTGVEAVAQSDRNDLAAVVRKATQGRGADLALNGVGASIFGAILESLRAGGRQVVYSAAGGKEFSLDLLSLYRKQVAILGLNTQLLNVVRCGEILKEIAPLFDSGALQPPKVGERYPLAEAANAYEQVASGKGGKAVFVMHEA